MADPAIIPGAIWRPDPISAVPIVPRWIILHTVVGTVAGSIGGRHYHCYYRANGSRIQIQDVRLRSAASVEANPYSVALVAEDKGPAFPVWSGSNVPAYTTGQVAALIEDLAWICVRLGLPATAIRTSRPTEGHGCGWHRLGINGNFPTTWPLWGRQPGGQSWSLSTGKACPGDRRIRQIVDVIIPAVQAELGDDMPLTADERAQLDKAAQAADLLAIFIDPSGKPTALSNRILAAAADAAAAKSQTDTLEPSMASLSARMDELTEMVEALSLGGVDPEVIARAVWSGTKLVKESTP